MSDYEEIEERIKEDYRVALERARAERDERLTALTTIRRLSPLPKGKPEAKDKPPVDRAAVLELVRKTIGEFTAPFDCHSFALPENGGVEHIRNALEKVSKEGVIEVVQKGAGKRATTYRRRAEEQQIPAAVAQ